MKCPKCNAEMVCVGFEQLVRDEIFEQWQCSMCGFRMEKKREKPAFH